MKQKKIKITKTSPSKSQEKTISTKEYNKLLTDIKNLIESGVDKANENGNSTVISTYWKIGERINEESLSTKSSYHNSILKEISDELEIERSSLSRYLNFYRTYKSPPINTILSWSHYRCLLAIKDEKLRKQLEQQAQEKGWSKERLISEINKAQKSDNDKNSKSLLKRPTDNTYLYKAKILEVIDGDTLILNIDLGFQVWKEQRVRLAQINCPEKFTKAGQKAFNFLRQKATTLDTILIQTKKIDIYGRYLAHIFYPQQLAGESRRRTDYNEIFKNGVYLNEEILRGGFGEVV